jgi:hypothetical protein
MGLLVRVRENRASRLLHGFPKKPVGCTVHRKREVMSICWACGVGCSSSSWQLDIWVWHGQERLA